MAGRNVTTLKCLTCGGVYAPVQADGMQYYHVCPPIACVQVQQQDGSIVIVPRHTETVEDTDPTTGAPRTRQRFVFPAGVDGDVIGEVGLARKDARNENPHPFDRDPNGKATIIATGRGVEPVAAPKVKIVGVTDAV